MVAHRQLDERAVAAKLDAPVTAAVLDRVRGELAEHQGERGRALGCEHDGRERAGLERPVERASQHPAQPPHEVGAVDVFVATRGQQVVHLGDREHAADRVAQRALGIDSAAGREPQERRDRLQVVLDAVMDFAREQPAHRATQRPRARSPACAAAASASSCSRALNAPGRDRQATSAPWAAAPGGQRHGQAAVLGERRQRGQLAELVVRRAVLAAPEGDLAARAARARDGERADLGVERAGGRLDQGRERVVELDRCPCRPRNRLERLQLAHTATQRNDLGLVIHAPAGSVDALTGQVVEPRVGHLRPPAASGRGWATAAAAWCAAACRSRAADGRPCADCRERRP